MKRGAALRPALVQKRQTVQQKEQKDKGIGGKGGFGGGEKIGQSPIQHLFIDKDITYENHHRHLLIIFVRLVKLSYIFS
ncbi:hypothetical protein VU05_02360 [Desulfobulbus sp. F1]|nr:hypothetical protein [Desulfobulbus sp. F1]